MFTGLVEDIGAIVSRKSNGKAGKIVIKFNKPILSPVIGESIAINGCCLTLEEITNDKIATFHTLEETLQRTNLGALPYGSMVNVERAMLANSRFGGHIVSGHIDGTSRVISMKNSGDDIEFKVAMLPELEPFMVEKGSITIDGISLTLVEVNSEFFTVHLIPITLKDTALGCRKVGEMVNLESDLVGKYVARQLALRETKGSKITMDTLYEAGFL